MRINNEWKLNTKILLLQMAKDKISSKVRTHTVSALRMHLASAAAASAKLGHWKQRQNRGVKQKYFYKCYS